jgi:TPR repeat protein
MHARLLNRAATYRQKNDNERAEAAESTASELQQIIVVYMNSTLRPPTAKQLKAMPYGDVSFYLKYDTQASCRNLAEQGNAEAQFVLGGLYYVGRGVPQDYSEAALWFRKAAEQGYAAAQHSLGRLYRKGQGVPQDDTQAAAWWLKAADQGNAVVQAALGLLYFNGQGVPQDYAEAYFWLDLATVGEQDASNSKLVVKHRDGAASHLTPVDLARAQERARKWFEAHQAKP